MKLLGSLLVTACLVLGAFAASTAYVVPVDSIDPQRDAVTLYAPAGVSDEVPDDPATPRQPLLEPGPIDDPLVLTAEHLDTLRDEGVRRVHVKEFSIRRWREAWLFGVAAAGLLVGSLLVRTAIRREVTAVASTTPEVATESPRQLLEGAITQARELVLELDGLADQASRRQTILRHVQILQDDYFEPFVYSRAKVINELGMGGYAQLMDRFAAAERQFNRAWSAAADGVADEAVLSIRRAVPLLEEAGERFQAPTAGPA